MNACGDGAVILLVFDLQAARRSARASGADPTFPVCFDELVPGQVQFYVSRSVRHTEPTAKQDIRGHRDRHRRGTIAVYAEKCEAWEEIATLERRR
jgi:hypothetical protein